MAKQVFRGTSNTEEPVPIIYSDREGIPSSTQDIVSNLYIQKIQKSRTTDELMLSTILKQEPTTTNTQRSAKRFGLKGLFTWLPRLGRRRTYDRPFQLVIALREENSHILSFGVAMIDFWSPCNIMSPTFGKRMVNTFESSAPYPLFNTLKGTLNAMKKVRVRWHVQEDLETKKPTMISNMHLAESDFHIMEHGDSFDVIIGRPDIIKFGILGDPMMPPLATANQFYRIRPITDDRTVQEGEEIAFLDPALEATQMRHKPELRRPRDEHALLNYQHDVTKLPIAQTDYDRRYLYDDEAASQNGLLVSDRLNNIEPLQEALSSSPALIAYPEHKPTMYETTEPTDLKDDGAQNYTDISVYNRNSQDGLSVNDSSKGIESLQEELSSYKESSVDPEHRTTTYETTEPTDQGDDFVQHPESIFVHNPNSADLEDVKTEYSVTFDERPLEKEILLSEVVNNLFGQLCDDFLNDMGQMQDQVEFHSAERISTVLPDLLKAFALKLGHSSQPSVGTQIHRDVMVFVLKYRRDISNRFRAKYREKFQQALATSLHEQKLPKTEENVEEKFDRWHVDSEATDPGYATEHQVDIEGLKDEVNEEELRAAIAHVAQYREFLHETTAYYWLIKRLRREYLLAPMEINTMDGISRSIMECLPSLHTASKRIPSRHFTMTFRLNWDPRTFIEHQEYGVDVSDVIETALTLTGSTCNLQALSCALYVRQVWPSNGAQVLKLVKDVVSSGIDVVHSCHLPDHTKLTAWMETRQFVVEASGTGSTLTEIAEELSWLGAALRNPEQPDQSGITYFQPTISRLHSLQLELDDHYAWRIDFVGRKELDTATMPNGQCWTGLFKSPVVVEGYPIPRCPDCTMGLQVTLGVVANLIHAARITVFDEKIFVKGFCAMLILEKYSSNVFVWHMLVNTDGSYISYLDARVSRIGLKGFNKLLLSSMGSAQHIIGWCSDANSHTGQPGAQYDIRRLKLAGSYDNLHFLKFLHTGEPIRLDHTITTGKREKGMPYSRGYLFQVKELLSDHWVLVCDVQDRRSWLVDGVSALLHLVRASLASEESSPETGHLYRFKFCEYDSRRSKHRAFNILENLANRAQILSEESTETFEDRVSALCCTLEWALASQKLWNSTEKANLLGLPFEDLVRNGNQIKLYAKRCSTETSAWIAFPQQLGAAVIFGSGFGELITPKDTTRLCQSWATVPLDKDYLAVCVSDLKKIIDTKGVQTEQPWRIVDNTCWRPSSHAFSKSCCRLRSSKGLCDLSQVLFRGSDGTDVSHAAFTKLDELPDAGAVVFRYGSSASSPEKTALESEPLDSRSSFGSSVAVYSETDGVITLPASLDQSSMTTVRTISQRKDPSSDDLFLNPTYQSRSNSLQQLNTSPMASSVEKVATTSENITIRAVVQSISSHLLFENLDSSTRLNSFMSWGWMSLPAISCYIYYMDPGFYWKTVIVSGLVTGLLYRLIISLQQSSSHQSFLVYSKLTAARLVWIVLLLWCVCLSPLHVLVSPLDLWTQYKDHAPVDPILVHDPRKFGNPLSADVFAIHGLGSNPSSAWTYRGNGTDIDWLKDILPYQDGCDGIRITMINHQTRWDSHVPDMDISAHAEMMLDDIQHYNQGLRPIIFIAHSFGGILLKKALVIAATRSGQQQQIAEMTKGILFLGVPHFGTKASFIASILACTAHWRGSSTTLLETISEGNPVLKDLNDEFREIYRYARHSMSAEFKLPYISNFLEMKPEKFWRLAASATVNSKNGNIDYGKHVKLDTDHRGLNKFLSASDPNFKKFLRQFQKALN